MVKEITVEGLANVFYEKGESCDFGCNENELDPLWDVMIKKAGHHKNVYAVKNWMWYDITLGDNKLEIIKADYVLRTTSRNFDVGDWVRTSPIHNFTDNCICETSNSFYILVGKGSRKESDESIFNFFG